MTADRCCLIIDSHPVVRLGIRRLLEPAYSIEELTDGRGAGDLMTNVGRFDVAVVEMRSAGPGGAPSGATTIRQLMSAQPSLGVVAHGGRIERHAMREALDAGASGYVSKRSAPTALKRAVEAAAVLESFIDPSADDAADTRLTVTRRQREILQLFADGLSTDDAARKLGLSAETIRTHAKASLSRLGARDRTHAVAIALRGSLIE